MNLPTLFKKTSVGKIQSWTIRVDGATIVTTYGQVGGKMQETSDTVVEGKNLGKANATTPQAQAELEAAAQHEKKRKKGYVLDPEDAKDGKVDDVVEGGYWPMLAEVWADHAEKVEFPVAIQPKLNGHRCPSTTLVWSDAAGNRFARSSLWSRTRKPILSMPHLTKELELILLASNFEGTAKLDGELYVHEYHNRFEKITSLIRPKEPREGHELVEYHCYDLVSGLGFRDRFAALDQLLAVGDKVKIVETLYADNEVQVLEIFRHFRNLDYEGAMARQLTRKGKPIPYEEGKRSQQLLKLKEFLDAEARIVRVVEGRGKLQGHCGALVCAMDDGREFSVAMAATLDEKLAIFQRPEEWVGQQLTYQYQNLSQDGIPVFPVGIRRRLPE